jgi:hypothetical protein
MENLQLSEHAKIRMQQRGISEKALQVLVRYGSQEYDHRGAKIFFLRRQNKHKVRLHSDEALAKHLESAIGVYAVVDVRGRVVTVGHRTQRINRN